jgi:hypothetical protein
MHLLVDGDVVVLATSPVQLDAYAAVKAGTRPSLAAAPDLAFFRRRYPLAAGAQGLAIISDATLRRWMGPRQIIGQAMREQAAWQLALLQARWIRAGADPAWIPTEVPRLLGEVAVDRDGVRSSRWGRPSALTPLAELDLDRVSATAARSYEGFRDAYERSWRGVLDPIAAEIRVAPERIEVDLSVLPVRLDREYREIRRIAGAVRFAAGAPDVHDAVAAVSVALDRAGLAREMGGGLRGMLGRNVDPLGWVGEHGTLFADPGPAWDELRCIRPAPSLITVIRCP